MEALAFAFAVGLFDASEVQEAQQALPPREVSKVCWTYYRHASGCFEGRWRAGWPGAGEDFQAAELSRRYYSLAESVQNPQASVYCRLRYLRWLEASWPDWRTRVPSIP